jgi:hypothetical protein
MSMLNFRQVELIATSGQAFQQAFNFEFAAKKGQNI